MDTFPIWVMLLCFLAASGGVSSCPTECNSCIYKDNHMIVDCMNRGLIAIPVGLDNNTHVLKMSSNNLNRLEKEAFLRSSLTNLQRIYLQNCNIGEIDTHALQSLSNLAELDLSHNLLTSVPSTTFKNGGLTTLYELSLAHNPIKKIEIAAFEHLNSLQKLDLSYCHLTFLAPKAFEGIPRLEYLQLENNRLVEMSLQSVSPLVGLKEIKLHDNPWQCDCRLRWLKKWIVDRNLAFPIQPKCLGGPARIQNKSFSLLQADHFACKPQMINTKNDAHFIETAVGDNATIVCRVDAAPSANITWYLKERPLTNNTVISQFQKVIISETDDNENRRSVLTLTNAQETDSTQFVCRAENAAGQSKSNFTLRVVHKLRGFAFLGSYSQAAQISLALVGIIAVILMAIVALLYRIRQVPNSRREKQLASSGGGGAGNGDHIPNGIVHTANDNKAMTIEQSSLEYKKPSYSPPPIIRRNECQTLPRLNNGLSSAAYVNHNMDIGPQGGPTLLENNYVIRRTTPQTSNPDLIADTRYQQGDTPSSALPIDGQYQRSRDLFYPTNLWSDHHNDHIVDTNNLDVDADDTTPIIEDMKFCPQQAPPPIPARPKREYEFPIPTTSSLAQSTHGLTLPNDTSSPNSVSTNSPLYGPPSDAKIMRVWQNGVHVLPPVTALKRVLARNSPDEGFQDGCGTDV